MFMFVKTVHGATPTVITHVTSDGLCQIHAVGLESALLVDLRLFSRPLKDMEVYDIGATV